MECLFIFRVWKIYLRIDEFLENILFFVSWGRIFFVRGKMLNYLNKCYVVGKRLDEDGSWVIICILFYLIFEWLVLICEVGNCGREELGFIC